MTLPTQVVLTVTECGEINAFYSRNSRVITLCLELISNYQHGVAREFSRIATPQEIQQMINGGIMFTLMHELGRALIHVLDLRVLGREEDAADQIGTFFMLHSTTAPNAIAAILWSWRPRSILHNYADAHSLNPQRQVNVACWAYGKDPQKYGYLERSPYLPRSRAPRCSAEYDQLDSAVRRLLGAKVQLPSGR